jgi:hypothetical protein
MGMRTGEAVPILLELLQEGSAKNRNLVACGQGVEPISAPFMALRESNEGVRKMAQEVLKIIPPSRTQAKTT